MRGAALGACVAGAAVILVAALGARAGAEPRGDMRERAIEAISGRLAAVERSDGVLATQAGRRHEHLEMRVRSLYKLERAAELRRWVDVGEREGAAWRRLAARRLIAREARERRLVMREREALMEARLDVFRAIGDVARARFPEEESLLAPARGEVVSKFGRAWDPDSRVTFSRRGVRLGASEGEAVIAPAAGEVVYAGGLRNLGDGVVIEHADGLRTLLAGRLALGVSRGEAVSEGQALAEARGEPVYMEVRLPIGGEGFPVDPEPLIAPSEADEQRGDDALQSEGDEDHEGGEAAGEREGA